jgi:two-component system LytT family response regulator
MAPRVLIVDDEPLARERLSTLVALVAPKAELREAGNGEEAVEAIRAWEPTTVFLDVQMPGLTGFEVVDAIGAEQMPATVFVTAYDQHALRAFEVAAVDYLLKPFDEERFRAAWKRATRADASKTLLELMAQMNESAGRSPQAPSGEKRWADRVVVKKNQRTILIKLADVQWIESSGNYVALHVGKETHEVRETLTSIESRLDPQQFVRIHRRMIVAVDAMRELQPWFGGDQVMIMKDGTQLRVSRSYREQVAKRLAGMA